jgi:hemerythrin superfamily protein
MPRKTVSKSNRRTTKPKDAIALLKRDHREVEAWFEQFEKARDADRKRELASKICTALKVHTQIEEEVFYPAFIDATQEEDIHHEAIIEHDGAKKLIAEIERSSPSDEYFDARVTVLSEMIKHHVKEEEQRDGMFAKAKASDLDLTAVGQRLAERKEALMGSQSGRRTRGRSAARPQPATAPPDRVASPRGRHSGPLAATCRSRHALASWSTLKDLQRLEHFYECLLPMCASPCI